MLALVVLVTVPATNSAQAADRSSPSARLAVAPPANWVKPQPFDLNPAAAELDAATESRLLLAEQQINAQTAEVFSHYVRQIRTISGVQNGATVSIDFNPDYQWLTLHWVRIWRGRDSLDRLDTNKINLIRKERGLEEDLTLDGRHSAVLVLDDVRIGDILDYSYSTRGTNPVFGGRFAWFVPVQFGQPADRLVSRLLWPSPRRLYSRAHRCAASPAAAMRPGILEYTWDFRDVPAYHTEDGVPSWFEPEPWVQLSDFQSWAEVNQWALRLFQTVSPPSPALLEQIALWRQVPGHEQQVLTALRFVQDEIRYFGVEIGASAQKPADPSLVFSRRYGDCKDKSLLLVSILRALGFSAYPVLVNTESRRSLDDRQPSACVFDHCIVVVQCDNRTAWLDPTAQYQRGPLAAHYLPKFERGLVLSPVTTGLTSIPNSSGIPRTTTTEFFELGRAAEPSRLKVVTTSEGRDADRLRAVFASTPRTDIERSYTRFYAALYPGIRTVSPIEYQDDEQRNRATTIETYTIDKVWNGSPSGGYFCTFHPSAIAALLKTPVDRSRKMPLAISYPEHLIVRSEIRMPVAWIPDAGRKTISDPAFRFRKEYRRLANKLYLEYEYESFDDSVSPEQVAHYLQHESEASDALGYSLIWDW